MEHSFDIDIAKRYGIPAAVLLKNIHFWIEKNRANEQNFYDGYYWTYNSKKAFAELFPYMTSRQIDYALQKLIDDGLIITGNYNKVAYDRTLWYAITKLGYSILQNCEMETTKMLNGNAENVQPIPNINAVENTGNKPNKKKERAAPANNSFDNLIEQYSKGDEEVKRLLGEWLKVRKAKRAAMTDYAIESNLKKLEKLSKQSEMGVAEYLDEVIRRGWQAFYAINTFSKGGGKATGETAKSFNAKDAFNAAFKRTYGNTPRAALERDVVSRSEEKAKNPPKTAAEDEAVREKMELLKKRLGG